MQPGRLLQTACQSAAGSTHVPGKHQAVPTALQGGQGRKTSQQVKLEGQGHHMSGFVCSGSAHRATDSILAWAPLQEAELAVRAECYVGAARGCTTRQQQ